MAVEKASSCRYRPTAGVGAEALDRRADAARNHRVRRRASAARAGTAVEYRVGCGSGSPPPGTVQETRRSPTRSPASRCRSVTRVEDQRYASRRRKGPGGLRACGVGHRGRGLQALESGLRGAGLRWRSPDRGPQHIDQYGLAGQLRNAPARAVDARVTDLDCRSTGTRHRGRPPTGHYADQGCRRHEARSRRSGANGCPYLHSVVEAHGLRGGSTADRGRAWESSTERPPVGKGLPYSPDLGVLCRRPLLPRSRRR